jgi:G3E family GTPase
MQVACECDGARLRSVRNVCAPEQWQQARSGSSSKEARVVVESIVVIVGFLGAGKTSLLTLLVEQYSAAGWDPYVILNDYENAQLDAQQLGRSVSLARIKALTGSWICCSGINELREAVNRIPERERGLTLIEANGTTDACSLMGFLGVGLHERFKPPVQISVVDVKNWQRRQRSSVSIFGKDYNELEASQVRVSSLVVLTHLDAVSDQRRRDVQDNLRNLNPHATLTTREAIDPLLLPELEAAESRASGFEHRKAHWASCSIDLPRVPHLWSIQAICDLIPPSILRVKGCTRVGDAAGFIYFERCPDGEVYVRPFHGTPETGPKLLAVGPGSDPVVLEKAVENGMARLPPSPEQLAQRAP